MQPSLFTRLLAVEAELQAMKTLVAELKVNQDALRYDRDEWRWRAEQLIVDQQRGTWWRWCRRIAAALNHAASRYGSLAELRDKLLAAIKESWAVAPLRIGQSAWREDFLCSPPKPVGKRGATSSDAHDLVSVYETEGLGGATFEAPSQDLPEIGLRSLPAIGHC